MDKTVDWVNGGGSIHVTPGIVFQEEVPETETRSSNTNRKRSNRRSLNLTTPSNMVVAKINPKKNPNRFLHCDYSVTANTTDINTDNTMEAKRITRK